MSTAFSRAVPALRALASDDDLRDSLLKAGRAGRAAALKPAPRPTRLKRAGTAVRSLGDALTRAGAKAEAARRARRRSLILRGSVVGGAGAAAAVAIGRSRSTTKTPEESPNV